MISFPGVPSLGFCESLHSNLAARVPWEPLSLEPGGPRVLILRVPWVSQTTPGVPTHLRGGPDGKASSTQLGSHSGAKAGHAAPQPRPHRQPRLSTVKAAWPRSVRRGSTPGAGLRAQRASQLALRAAFQTALRGLPLALFGCCFGGSRRLV